MLSHLFEDEDCEEGERSGSEHDDFNQRVDFVEMGGYLPQLG
jgi:hypothetical protein